MQMHENLFLYVRIFLYEALKISRNEEFHFDDMLGMALLNVVSESQQFLMIPTVKDGQ